MLIKIHSPPCATEVFSFSTADLNYNAEIAINSQLLGSHYIQAPYTNAVHDENIAFFLEIRTVNGL